MSILYGVVKEEFNRGKKQLQIINSSLKELPKGRVKTREINGNIYYYWQYREGKHVKEKYIKKNELNKYKQTETIRKNKIQMAKQILNSMKDARKLLKYQETQEEKNIKELIYGKKG